VVDVGVRDDEVERLAGALIGRDEVAGLAELLLEPDAPHGRGEAELAPSSSNKRTNALTRAPVHRGEEHAPLALEVMDERVDGAGVERVSADEQRVERERLPDVLVLDEARDGAVDGPIGAQARELRRDADHVGEAQEGRRRELVVALLEHTSRVVDEPRVALGVARVAGADLLEHGLGVAHVVEAVAVVQTKR